MNDLKENWKALILTILYPWVIIFLVFTFIFLFLQFNNTDPLLITLFSVLISLSAGILGGFVTKRWEDITEEKIVANKGRSAIRNLWHILGGISLIRRRVIVYLSRHGNEDYEEEISDEVIKTYLEEIIEKCISTEIEVLNSIEDWSDILPEFLDVKPKVAEIQELSAKYGDLQKHVEELDERLDEPEGKSEEEIKRLTKEKKELENQLNWYKKELAEKTSQLGTTFITTTPSGSASLGGTSWLTPSPSQDTIFSDQQSSIAYPSQEGSVLGISFGHNQENEEEEEAN